MMLIMMFCMMILFILMFMSTFVMTLMKKKKLNFNKMSPFECGFNSMSNKRLPFSTHFFTIGIMFLIFDIEIIIIMPMILTMKMSMIKYWILSTTTMIMILIFGIYHEWKNGMLKWTK